MSGPEHGQQFRRSFPFLAADEALHIEGNDAGPLVQGPDVRGVVVADNGGRALLRAGLFGQKGKLLLIAGRKGRARIGREACGPAQRHIGWIAVDHVSWLKACKDGPKILTDKACLRDGKLVQKVLQGSGRKGRRLVAAKGHVEKAPAVVADQAVVAVPVQIEKEGRPHAPVPARIEGTAQIQVVFPCVVFLSEEALHEANKGLSFLLQAGIEANEVGIDVIDQGFPGRNIEKDGTGAGKDLHKARRHGAAVRQNPVQKPELATGPLEKGSYHGTSWCWPEGPGTGGQLAPLIPFRAVILVSGGSDLLTVWRLLASFCRARDSLP